MGIKTAFRKVMADFIQWVNNYEDSEPVNESKMASMASPRKRSLSMSTAISVGPGGFDGENGMNFTVYHAAGGKVIQIRTYDPRTDRNSSSLHVITDKENLGEELAQIITYGSLVR